MRFEIYEDARGEWRWRLVAKNGQTVADGGEGYKKEGNARRALKAFRHLVGAARIVVVEKAHE